MRRHGLPLRSRGRLRANQRDRPDSPVTLTGEDLHLLRARLVPRPVPHDRQPGGAPQYATGRWQRRSPGASPISPGCSPAPQVWMVPAAALADHLGHLRCPS
jgi:hypothetical protein